MYELIHVKGNSYYIESPAKIGLYKISDTEVCLFDSGNDKDAGKKVRKVLDANGWRLTAIYNTHSHADHIGGNRFLQQHTGCKIYAHGVECDFTRHPLLEPTALYGGYPPAELRHKFLMAQESDAEPLTPEVLPDGVEMIPLPGHSFDMVGFRTSDGVVYLADALSKRETLDKYGIGYVYDVAAYLETLEAVKSMQSEVFVPAHADVTEDISALAQYNIDRVTEAAEQIVSLCASPARFEDVLEGIFAQYAMKMTFEQYALIGSTVRSYLSWLKETGMIRAKICGNALLWERI